MTTVIRAAGTTFTAANLPDVDEFVKDGLVAAYRPTNKTGGLSDLSGNGNALTVVGSPVLTATGFVGDSKNGYNTTLLETKSLTYIGVFKIPAATSVGGAFTISTHSQTYGSSIYFKVVGRALIAQSRAYSTATSGNVDTEVGLGALGDEYVFVALTVNATTNTVTAYVPVLDIMSTAVVGSSSVANRVLSPVPLSIVASNSIPSWTSKVHISEAVVYNKALTATQVQAQYQKSKEYMQGIGITI